MTSSVETAKGTGFSSSLVAKLVIVAAIQLGLVALAVAPQLSARMFGEEYQLRVAPLDPIDPFRGAYVALDYPDLRANDAQDSRGPGMGSLEDGEDRGDVFVTLERDGEFWRAGSFSRSRPTAGPYLACSDQSWIIDCGIDSWFLPQDDALAMEEAVREGTAVATVRIDGRGHAALVDVSVTD